MIRVEHLCKTFPGGNHLRRLLRRHPAPPAEVLRDVSLQVDQGEFLALLGANGAGKTTLLKTIATLLLPSGGRVEVGGYDVTKDGRRVRQLVGYALADERSFYWRLNAWENLEFFASLNGIRTAAARERAAFLLKRLDLLNDAGRSFAEFSSGMKQRLAIARALFARPRVLLLDEPTRSIDRAHAAQIWELVREELAENNGCTLLVTHQLQEALSNCERVAILQHGQIILDSPAARISSYTADLDGFTLSVRGLTPQALISLQHLPAVRAIRVASEVAGEQVLEVWCRNGDLSLAAFLGELTELGATICSLKRSTPLQGVFERLKAESAERAPV